MTAEVTPVQVNSSARQGSITADQLQNIQMKGRDIYGLLAVVPGVQDSNLSRDFTSWTSANNITINGAPVTSNNIMIDGIAQRDEYGPTPSSTRISTRSPKRRSSRAATRRRTAAAMAGS